MIQGGLLFVAIPGLSAHLGPAYNHDMFADGYDLLADNLVTGHGYRFYPDTARTLMREPGYPVFLAGLLLVFGKNFAVVKIINMILALLTAWLTVRITRKLLAGARLEDRVLAIGPPLLFLFNPGTLIAESRGGVEILFGFLVSMFLLTIYESIASNKLKDYLISGGLLGFTVLVRSTPLLFPVFLLAYLLLFEGRRISRLVLCRNVAAMILAMLTVLSPWIIRNYALTGKFVPTASVMGVSAQAGQYINSHLLEGKPWWLLDREASRERDKAAAQLGYPFEDGPQGYYQTFYEAGNEIKFSNYLFARVLNNYRNSPALFARCLTQNVFNFWFAGKTWGTTAVNVAAQLPYLILAGIGIAFCLKSGRMGSAGPVLLFIAYIWAVHVPILAQARYSVPLMPFICSLGAVGLMSMRKRKADVAVKSETFVASGS
jgi:4-amino-4-deoxy-L-arabinose transferase-like glycosyltransferase